MTPAKFSDEKMVVLGKVAALIEFCTRTYGYADRHYVVAFDCEMGVVVPFVKVYGDGDRECDPICQVDYMDGRPFIAYERD
jgi:hypothetical protein